MATIDLVRDGYEFIAGQCAQAGTDVVETRVAGLPVICMRGAEAAEVFYSERFRRSGAMPSRVPRTAFGKGGIQALDGPVHHNRKAMFLSLMGETSIDDLVARAERGWHAAIERWVEEQRPVVLLDEAGRLLCRAVCDWAGVPLPATDVATRTRQFRELIEAPGSVGPAYVKGLRSRRRVDRWARGWIEAVRSGSLSPSEGRALHEIAWHRDGSGELLDSHVAAVELINLLRPAVVVDRYVAFAATALQEYPGWRERLQRDDEAIEWFVQETRRVYPFFPFLGAKVRADFDWNGTHFPAGRMVLLDCYGTNHRPGIWSDPERFDPERFRTWDGNPFSLLAQVGGDHANGRRCAGEDHHRADEAGRARARQRDRLPGTRPGSTHQPPAHPLPAEQRRRPRRRQAALRLNRRSRLRPVHVAACSTRA